MYASNSSRFIADLTASQSDTSVSYTHLDVYKRQAEAVQKEAVRSFLRAGGADGHGAAELYLQPVSYTHLDVYKRQADAYTLLWFIIQNQDMTLYRAVDCRVLNNGSYWMKKTYTPSACAREIGRAHV